MATVIKVDNSASMTSYAHMSIERWGERQGGAAFVSVNDNFIFTDYSHEHREVGLLLHILNCNNLSYKCITNIDLDNLAENLFAKAIIGKINNKKTQNKGAKNAD